MSSSMEFCKRPIIITDVETTGLDPGFHEIIDIGAIMVDHDLNEIARIDVKIKPDHIYNASPEALAINGYTPEAWVHAVPQPSAAHLFQSFSATGILCAWNITFEYSFLTDLFAKTGVPNRMDYHRIDIPSIAWMALPRMKKFSMDAVGAYFCLMPEPKPHRGIGGAEYELAILRCLRGLR